MDGKIIRNEKLNEQYYEYKHESGLEILLYPMKGYSSSYALFGTKYGSIDTAFKTDKEDDFVTVPEGIAHFLEHKLFESEELDAFELFAKTGASANAYTSFEKTCYLFSTTDNFGESLKNLLDFVQSPYFTEKTVQKEQGIIAQEIRMYDDSPGWLVFFNLLKALYVNHPVKVDIAGTVESIAKINADLLYRCYNTFYNLNNMVLAIAGNFKVDEALSVIENNLKTKEKLTVKAKSIDEPDDISTPRISAALSVSTPLFSIGYKEKSLSGYDMLKAELTYEVLLDIMFGKGSAFYKNLYEKGLINQTFDFEVFCGRDYFSVILDGESKDPDKVYESVNECIAYFKQNGVAKEDFVRSKKSLYGRLVKGFNNVENVANNLVNFNFWGVGIYDNIDVVEKMELEDVLSLLQNGLRKEKSALSIVFPSDK